MNKIKSIDLIKLYLLAKDCTDFDEFEQLIKSKLTGRPITVVIDCEIITILKR
jgi:hypothetical protein